MSLWSTRVLPVLVEKACRSSTILDERRRWIPRAHGEVLELGIGSGLNLAFYDAARVAKVTGIDPSLPLLVRAAARAGDASVPVELVEASAERLPFPAESFDSAVVTYSLCSVDDPARALAEVRRVLRPSGQLVFVEHGLAPDGGTRRWQHRLTPIWRRLGGGCHLDRDIAGILRDAGYELDELSAAYSEGVRWLSFTYQGTAHPRRGPRRAQQNTGDM
jgi:SAM-dependent methyltransferase